MPTYVYQECIKSLISALILYDLRYLKLLRYDLYDTHQTKSCNMLHPVKVTPQVWYLVGIHLIDAFRTSAEENCYLLTQTDYYSKYIEAIPLPDKSASSVAKGHYKTYCQHRAPAHIISDQGSDFVNQIRSTDFEII